MDAEIDLNATSRSVLIAIIARQRAIIERLGRRCPATGSGSAPRHGRSESAAAPKVDDIVLTDAGQRLDIVPECVTRIRRVGNCSQISGF